MIDMSSSVIPEGQKAIRSRAIARETLMSDSQSASRDDHRYRDGKRFAAIINAIYSRCVKKKKDRKAALLYTFSRKEVDLYSNPLENYSKPN